MVFMHLDEIKSYGLPIFFLLMIFRKFSHDSCSFFYVFPVFFVKLNANYTTSAYMVNWFTSKFVNKSVNAMVMTKNYS